MSTPTAGMPRPYAIHDGLAVYRFGKGRPVLLMPGPHRFQQPGHRSADVLIAGLTRLRHQVITFDPPGSGRSTRPARLGMPEMHQCADEALEIGGTAGPVDALGHSMGGLALLAYAIERPARISRTVLVGTGSGGPAYMRAPGALWNRSHPAFWRLALLGMLHILWPRLGPQKMLLNFIQHYSFHDPSQAQPEPINLRDWLRPKQGRTDWHRIARKLDYAPRLREIEAPALILVGRFDPQYPPSASEELATGIPNARLVYFEHSGHYPFIEEPVPFWEAVDDFFWPEKTPDEGEEMSKHNASFPSEIPWEHAIKTPQVIRQVLKDDGAFPNNDKRPLLVYQDALDLPADDPASIVEAVFAANGWVGSWRNGIYGYHHYHSTAHEVLGVYSGSAQVQLGGEQGVSLSIKRGDVVIIPAGVAHKNLGSTPDFRVVGAYPGGQGWDMNYGKVGERPRADQNIVRVPLPQADPVYGSHGPLREHWSEEG
jgi:uncharacterized protein YjlB/pimeloyl-ACP methyl ester carboxylesterase